MSTQKEKLYPGDIVFFEEDRRYSRKVMKVAKSQSLTPGSICTNETGGMTLFADANSDNTAGVCIDYVETDANNTAEAVFITKHAIVKQDYLNVDDGATLATAISDIEDLGIEVRDSIMDDS